MCVSPFLMKGAQRVYVTTCTVNTHASPLFPCEFTGIRRVRVLPFGTASIRIEARHAESHRVTPSHTESQCVLITSFSLGYPLSSRSAANYTRPPLYSYAFIFSCPSTRCCGFSASPVSSKFFSRCRLNPLDLTAGYGKTSRESAIRHFTQHR